MKNHIKSAFLVVLAFTLTGGTTMAAPVDDAKVNQVYQIQDGITTKAQVISLFGQPQKEFGDLGSGELVIEYCWHKKVQGTSDFDNYVADIFSGSESDEIQKLDITLDGNDVVAHHSLMDSRQYHPGIIME